MESSRNQSLSSRLLSVIKNKLTIKRQIVLYLFFARVSKTFRKSCKDIYLDRRRSSLLEEPNAESYQRDDCFDQYDNFERDTGIPELPPLLRWLWLFSNSYMYYVIAKGLLPYDLLTRTLNLPHPSECYFPGRMILFRQKSHVAYAALLALHHMVYRLWQRYRKNLGSLNVIMFCLLDIEDVEQSENLDNFGWRTKMSLKGKYLRYVICRKQTQRSREIYHRRCHRDLASFKIIRNMVTVITISAISIFSVLFIIIFPIYMYILSSEDWYLLEYPDCSHQKRGSGNFWPLVANIHWLITGAFDTVESCALWCESGFAVTFVLSLAYVLNYDMMLYWRYLHRRLHALDLKLKIFRLDEDNSLKREFFFESCPGGAAYIGRQQEINNERMYDHETKELRNEIEDVQWEICDFFQQVANADSLISDIITTGYIVWFSALCVIAYHKAQFSEMMHYDFRFIMVFGFIEISIITLSLMSLSRAIKKSYTVMCSIMAFDQSSRKFKFTKIIEYFSTRSSYTILHGLGNLTGVTYIKLVGFSLSCVIIVLDLLKPKS